MKENKNNHITSTKCQYNNEQLTKKTIFNLKFKSIKKIKPTKTWKPWKPVPKKNIEQKEKLDIVKKQTLNSIIWLIKKNKPRKIQINKFLSKTKFK